MIKLIKLIKSMIKLIKWNDKVNDKVNDKDWTMI